MKRALAIVLAAAIAGCSSPQPDNSAAGVPITTDSLQLTLETDKTSYRSGEPIEVILKLTNRSDRDRELEFSSSQRYDFQIVDTTGETRWTWSADRSFAQMLGTEQLTPGDTREYRERFRGPLPRGKYTVTGSVTVMRTPLRSSTTITVQ